MTKLKIIYFARDVCHSSQQKETLRIFVGVLAVGEDVKGIDGWSSGVLRRAGRIYSDQCRCMLSW